MLLWSRGPYIEGFAWASLIYQVFKIEDGVLLGSSFIHQLCSSNREILALSIIAGLKWTSVIIKSVNHREQFVYNFSTLQSEGHSLTCFYIEKLRSYILAEMLAHADNKKYPPNHPLTVFTALRILFPF